VDINGVSLDSVEHGCDACAKEEKRPMRPVREIPDEFFDLDEDLGQALPLMERFLASMDGRRPLEGSRLLLIQHQLSNQVAMVDALIRLGVDPNDIHWLDIPYTSTRIVREHVVSQLDLDENKLRVCDDYRVLKPYANYQYKRAVKIVMELAESSEMPLLVLDDGAYVLKALSALYPDRWPQPMGLIEQTTRGIIKIEKSAAMRAASYKLPLVDVAQSVPKRSLEPPFIAMAVCASLERAIRPLLKGRTLGSALVLGYGAIGEQVATYLTAQFGIDKKNAFVHDPDDDCANLAVRRGFKPWNPADLSQCFDLVIGCSGRASFALGDRVFLNDGALLASASSGTVELSRKEFVELADASDLDDIEILRDSLDERNLHANVDIRLVDRTVTFVNAGFPVNFDGGINTIPARYIQQTPVMMAAATVQLAEALRGRQTGRLELGKKHCSWVESNFRDLLGEDAHYLIPPPEEAW
jgi:S-adenosylhomocysteine hydrolase